MKYKVIYADPPWSYKNKKTGRTNGNQPEGSGAHTKYPTMSLDEIKALPIKNISEKNSILFLWATVPLLPEAFEVMESWGYRYKTMITWHKIMSLGMGYWFRGQTEHLLLGVKGNIKAFRQQVPNFYQSKTLRHSEKPEYFRELIDKAIPETNRIELFARKKTEGWDVWGNEVESDINLEFLKQD